MIQINALMFRPLNPNIVTTKQCVIKLLNVNEINQHFEKKTLKDFLYKVNAFTHVYIHNL